MKKFIGIIAVLLTLAVLLSACAGKEGGGEETQDSGSVSDSEASLTEPTATETEPEITDKITVTESHTEIVIITEVTEQTTEEDPIDTNNQVVQTAEALIGIAFAENGATPADGFDNSGFIYYVLRENGFINCPRLTQEQAAMGTHIGYDELRSGDLAFFCTADSGNPDFGGIYIGEGQMIYSPMPGQTVKIADITSDYWKGAFVTGVSLS